MRRPPATRCPGHWRHWYSTYGRPGDQRPNCVRCGAPNPRYPKPKERTISFLGGMELGMNHLGTTYNIIKYERVTAAPLLSNEGDEAPENQ